LKTRVKIGLRFSSARTLKFHADEAEHTRLGGFSTTGAVLFTGGGESRAIFLINAESISVHLGTC
jgi:hypothetical protein